MQTCGMWDDVCPSTHHIERHDDHKVDADTGARGGELPVLLHKIPVKGSKLLHRNKAENHYSKHCCQNEGNLSRGDGEKTSTAERMKNQYD